MAVYEGETGSVDGDILALCTRVMPKSGKAALKWAFPLEMPKLRTPDGNAADELISSAYFYLMLTAKTMEMPPSALAIRAELHEGDLHRVAVEVFQQWMAEDAPAKHKAAILLLAAHADDDDILTLHKQIETWADASRGAIASDAVRAMVLSGRDLALMTVDNIGRKFKNKQVRRAAQEGFAAAAVALGIPVEALGDRIIPTLGFDERGEKTIDYGTRSFTAILSLALTVELQDDTGKKIKSLPKPGAKDDLEKAEAAKKEFAALKKSLKAVTTTQAVRLEQALATGRRWTAESWQKLFVQNPIMHSFAIGLIWGVYDGETLCASFRYMEDGTFTTVDEDEFDFSSIGDNTVGLVHPLDLDEETLVNWRTQLEDYDITQPLAQLDRPLYRITEKEMDALVFDRFGGRKLLGITLTNKLQKSGWYKGSVLDGGAFYTFYREIGEIGMQLNFNGMYVVPDVTDEITIGQVGFYKANSINRGSYVYDEIKKEDIIPLRDIAPRLFSELVLDVENATATFSETDENWKKDCGMQFFD
jgi:hypothetical protein